MVNRAHARASTLRGRTAVQEFDTFEPTVQITNKGANGTTCMRLQYCNFQLITRVFLPVSDRSRVIFLQRVVYKEHIILKGLNMS
jgi:hypothetical protein